MRRVLVCVNANCVCVCEHLNVSAATAFTNSELNHWITQITTYPFQNVKVRDQIQTNVRRKGIGEDKNLRKGISQKKCKSKD